MDSSTSSHHDFFSDPSTHSFHIPPTPTNGSNLSLLTPTNFSSHNGSKHHTFDTQSTGTQHHSHDYQSNNDKHTSLATPRPSFAHNLDNRWDEFSVGRCVWYERNVRGRVLYWPSEIVQKDTEAVPNKLTIQYLKTQGEPITATIEQVEPFLQTLQKHTANGRKHGGLDFMAAVAAAAQMEDKLTAGDAEEEKTDHAEADGTSDANDSEHIDGTSHTPFTPSSIKHESALEDDSESEDDDGGKDSDYEHKSPVRTNMVPSYTLTPPTGTGHSYQSLISSHTPSSTSATGDDTTQQYTPNGKDDPNAVHNIKQGARIRLRAVDQIHHKLREYAMTEALITEIPVHPNTWYGVRLCDGTEIKLRKSAFDVIPPGATNTVIPPALNFGVIPPHLRRVNQGQRVILKHSPETAPYPVLIGQQATVVEAASSDGNKVYALRLSNGHVIQLPRTAFSAIDQPLADLLVNPAATSGQSPNVSADETALNLESPSNAQQSSAETANWLIGQAVLITHGRHQSEHGIISSIQGETIFVNVHGVDIPKRLDQLQLLVDSQHHQQYYQYLTEQSGGVGLYDPITGLRKPPTMAAEGTLPMGIASSYAMLSPAHASRFLHHNVTAGIRPRNSNKQLLQKYVSVQSGKYKGEIGLVTRGGNGYFTIQLLRHFQSLMDSGNTIMKRSSDMQMVAIPLEMTPEEYAERVALHLHAEEQVRQRYEAEAEAVERARLADATLNPSESDSDDEMNPTPAFPSVSVGTNSLGISAAATVPATSTAGQSNGSTYSTSTVTQQYEMNPSPHKKQRLGSLTDSSVLSAAAAAGVGSPLKSTVAPSPTAAAASAQSSPKPHKARKKEKSAITSLMDLLDKKTPTPKAAMNKRDWPAPGTQMDEADAMGDHPRSHLDDAIGHMPMPLSAVSGHHHPTINPLSVPGTPAKHDFHSMTPHHGSHHGSHGMTISLDSPMHMLASHTTNNLDTPSRFLTGSLETPRANGLPSVRGSHIAIDDAVTPTHQALSSTTSTGSGNSSSIAAAHTPNTNNDAAPSDTQRSGGYEATPNKVQSPPVNSQAASTTSFAPNKLPALRIQDSEDGTVLNASPVSTTSGSSTVTSTASSTSHTQANAMQNLNLYNHSASKTSQAY